MVEAIIFDMDGVLFDTEKYYYDRRCKFLSSKGNFNRPFTPVFLYRWKYQASLGNILRDDYDNWDVPIYKKSIML